MNPTHPNHGPNFGRQAFIRPLSTALLPGVALLVAGWALFSHGEVTRPLEASGAKATDTDLDGLPDRQEVILGTNPLVADTDFDGFTDGEEFALQTDPTLFEDAPSRLGLSIGMSARGEQGKLKVFIAVHAGDGNLQNKVVRFGALSGRTIINLPLERLAPFMVTNLVSTPHGGVLYTIDLIVNQEFVQQHGTATLFGVVGIVGEPRYAAGAKADLSVVDGVLMLRLPAPGAPGNPAVISSGLTIHLPIPPDGDAGVPIDWEVGKVCFQLSEVVGTAGNLVIHEIIHAECESGWDTYCEADCAATAHSTFTTVDPGSLLGG